MLYIRISVESNVGWKRNKTSLQQRNSLEGQDQSKHQLKIIEPKQPSSIPHISHIPQIQEPEHTQSTQDLSQSSTSLRVQLQPQGSLQEEGRVSMLRRISSLRRISRSSSWKLSKNLFGTKLR